MDKIDMRDWVGSLENIIDKKLGKWKKHNKIENGEAVQLRWQYQQTHVHLDIFWEDGCEFVSLHYLAPRADHSYRWHGLSNETSDHIMDRVFNLAQITMNPPIAPGH